MTTLPPPPEGPPAADRGALPYDPARPTLAFMGFKTNIPPGAAEHLAATINPTTGCHILLEAVPTLLTILASIEVYGKATLSSETATATYIARSFWVNNQVVLNVMPTSSEHNFSTYYPYDPTRLPAGLRSFAEDLLADPLGSVATHPIPLATRNVVATAAALLAEVIEKAEKLGDRPHGAVSLRAEAVKMAGYIDLLTRALRDPAAPPLLPAELERMNGSAQAAYKELCPLLYALDANLTEEAFVPPYGIHQEPADA